MSTLYSFSRIVRKYSRYAKNLVLICGDTQHVFKGAILPVNITYEEAEGGLRVIESRDLVSMQNLRALCGNAPLASLHVQLNNRHYDVVEERNFDELSNIFLYRLQAYV